MTLPSSALAADPVVDEKFDAGVLPAGWTAREGAWEVSGGRLVGRSTSSAQISRLTFGPRLENFRFEATVRFESLVNGDGTRWTALGLDMPASGRAAVVARRDALEHDGRQRHRDRAAHGRERLERAGRPRAAPSAAGVGRDVRVAIDVYGRKTRCFFDGTLVQEAQGARRARPTAGSASSSTALRCLLRRCAW